MYIVSMEATHMNQQEAIQHAYRLWKKWVSFRPAYGRNGYLGYADSPEGYRAFDLDKIHECMLHEARWHRTGKSNATPGLIKEVKGELILLGKVRAALHPRYLRRSARLQTARLRRLQTRSGQARCW